MIYLESVNYYLTFFSSFALKKCAKNNKQFYKKFLDGLTFSPAVFVKKTLFLAYKKGGESATVLLRREKTRAMNFRLVFLVVCSTKLFLYISFGFIFVF